MFSVPPITVMTGDSVDIARIAEEFELDNEFTWGSNVKLTGKSGALHKFDLVVTSKKDENVRIAVLHSISEDLVSDIMKFNAIASDCGISLKALVVEKDLDDTEVNLTHMYNIVTIDQRRSLKPKSDIFDDTRNKVFFDSKHAHIALHDRTRDEHVSVWDCKRHNELVNKIVIFNNHRCKGVNDKTRDV